MLTQRFRSHGFTVVELAVVIVVIAILATIGFFGYQQIQMQARDSKRQSDIASMQSALENYYKKNNEYPDPNDTAFFKKLSDQGIVDPTDKPEWTRDRRSTGYCANAVRWGGGEGEKGPSCRNYAYVSQTGATGFTDTGQYYTGCQVMGRTAGAFSWYVLMWYNEQTKTIYYKGNNVTVSKNTDSQAFPGQQCVLQ